MKLLLLLVIYLTASFADAAWHDFITDNLNLSETEKSAIVKNADECLAETYADVALFEKINNKQFPDNRELKCFFACFAKKIKILKDDGQYNLSALKDKLSERRYNATLKCSEIIRDDLCDQVYDMHKCYVNELKK